MWYREVGFSSVFWTVLGSRAALGAAFGVTFFLFTLLNLLFVIRLMPVYRRSLDPDDPLERYRGAFIPYIRWIAIGISAFLGLMFGITVTSHWDKILLALNGVSFGAKDAVFGRDIGFYVFKLPFYQFLYGWLLSGLVVVILMVAAAHYLTGGIRPQAPGDRVTPQVKAHLSALVGLAVLLRAWGYRLNQFELLYSDRGEVTGASYTDINAERPALTLLIIILVIVAVLFLVNIRQRGWSLPLAGVGLWLLIALLGKGLFPFVVERFRVQPAQLQKERPFIDRNIKATRLAYGLSDVQVTPDYPAIEGITQAAVNENSETIGNIRLWDTKTLMAAYAPLQEIRPYYRFEDVDVDRYEIDGKLRQVMLSARELAPEALETRSWQNEHIVYTHGYGVVVSPTNESTPEGEPTFLVKDVPPTTDIEELTLKQPRIYYGEGLEGIDYSLVGTSQRELDYGTQDETQYSSYKGEGGVGVSGLLRRIAFAWRFRNINLAITGLVQDDSRIIYYRDIRERLQLAAPFLQYDGDPYPVIADGRLVWMADAYTVTDMFPYSERIDFAERTLRARGTSDLAEPAIQGKYNYIRNSVKATVDAYDGTVRFYVWDDKDPIIKAWRDIFPRLFVDASEMPDSLRSHVRYPEDLLRIQSYQYRRYHMTQVDDFFTREDQWAIPADPNLESGAGTTVLGETQPYYVLMKLPGSPKLEYQLILPMNPRGENRRNMIAYLSASSDPETYGALRDYRFPKNRQIDGVQQVHARINQDPLISRTRSLLDQAGSKVIFGNLLVIPLGESILYVQPLFLQASQSGIPELKNVILATSDRVVMGTSIQESLRLLLEGGPSVSEGASQPEDPGAPEGEAAEAEALRHLEAAERAAREGDWATFGRELELAKQALQRGAGTPSPSPSP